MTNRRLRLCAIFGLAAMAPALLGGCVHSLVAYLDARIDGRLVQARGIFAPTKRNRDNELVIQNLELHWDRAVQGVLEAVVEDFVLGVEKLDDAPRPGQP